jgi:RNA polymerase sigma-70 factor (ECF subfamily)
MALATAAGNDTDPGLARRVAAGETAAFEAIMRRHNRMLFRAARAILHDDTEAEDCLQSAYLLAFRSIGRFAGQSKLSTWLARIVINEAIGRSRRIARRGVEVPIGHPHDDAPRLGLAAESAGPEEQAMRNEMRRLVEARIDALPEPFRVVFVLRAVEDLSVEEAAAVLGIPEATVRTRFFRARGMLREALAREVDLSVSEAFAFDGGRCDRIVAAVMARIQAPP